MHRTHLMRFARLQLRQRNHPWPEDASSETLIAALQKPQSFCNWSQLKTGLVGVLKHKTIDHIPSIAREPTAPGNGRVTMAVN